jgi:phosphohistidine phosphatase
LRHADAGDPEGWTGPDAARPLSEKGRRQSERLGRFLAAAGIQVDGFISSPKIRARETAELVAGTIGASVSLDDRLASGLDLNDVEAVLRDAGSPRRPVLVGHDPDFSDILSSLAGAPGISMKKGAIARIDLDDRLGHGGGTLRWLIPPDVLPR